MTKSESIVKVASALVKAQTEMGDAVKDSKNPFFKSSYADLNAIREAVIPALNKQGISVLQPTVVVEGRNYVRTMLMHESGEYLTSDTEILCAKQNDPQAYGSGISYARRYGLQSFLNVGAVDDDGEGAMQRNNATVKALPPVSRMEPVTPSLPAGSGAVSSTTSSPESNGGDSPKRRPSAFRSRT